jgi:hypothetical protein
VVLSSLALLDVLMEAFNSRGVVSRSQKILAPSSSARACGRLFNLAGNVSARAIVRPWRGRLLPPLWYQFDYGIQDTVAMTAVRILQGSLLISSVATVGLETIVQYQIYRHLRRQHRKAFDGLGIPSPSFLWREDRQADISSAAFEQFFTSRHYQALKDRQLNALLRRVGFLRWMSTIGFALLLITLFVFRADSSSLWDFMIDLWHY